MKNKVLRFIETVRMSFDGAEKVYTCGSCYQFFKILKEVFPQAKAYYNSDHVITRIEDHFYDITGEVDGAGHLDMELHYRPDDNVKECKFNLYYNPE